MNEFSALLALHVIAVAVLTMLSSYIFVARRRLLIDDVLIYKSLSS